MYRRRSGGGAKAVRGRAATRLGGGGGGSRRVSDDGTRGHQRPAVGARRGPGPIMGAPSGLETARGLSGTSLLPPTADRDRRETHSVRTQAPAALVPVAAAAPGTSRRNTCHTRGGAWVQREHGPARLLVCAVCDGRAVYDVSSTLDGPGTGTAPHTAPTGPVRPPLHGAWRTPSHPSRTIAPIPHHRTHPGR
ncbi:MAG: hypothetical protein WDW36_003404 [Sanguina aurantia]